MLLVVIYFTYYCWLAFFARLVYISIFQDLRIKISDAHLNALALAWWFTILPVTIFYLYQGLKSAD